MLEWLGLFGPWGAIANTKGDAHTTHEGGDGRRDGTAGREGLGGGGGGSGTLGRGVPRLEWKEGVV